MRSESKSATVHTSSALVHGQRAGRAGVLTLNRAEALNALSLEMVTALKDHLLEWRTDPGVKFVVIRSIRAQGKPPAFCAGGDIRYFYKAALSGDPSLERFFVEEYTLDFLVHDYPKPVIALMDGVVMGGGMGLSQGATLRIVSERSKLAMPETQIGLFPDVGGGWFLSRCPGSVGEYLGLTGATATASDALWLRFADLCVPGERMDDLLSAILQSADFGEAQMHAERMKSHAGPSLLQEQHSLLERHFSLSTVSDIVHSLESDDGTVATKTLAALRQRSPLMLAVTLRQIRMARHMSLADCFRMELGLMHQSFSLPSRSTCEPLEGIRALLIDKDRNPKWQPADIRDVTEEMVDRYFAAPWPENPLERLERSSMAG
jgi:enoyl-CoA hydratase/carnithine racemase